MVRTQHFHCYSPGSIPGGELMSIKLHCMTKTKTKQDSPGGPVAKNPPTNAGDMGSIPAPGRFHLPWGGLSLCATTTEPVHSRAYALPLQRSHCKEKPRHCS